MGWAILALAAVAAFTLGRASSAAQSGGSIAPPPSGVRRIVVNGRAAIVRAPASSLPARFRVVLYGHGFGAAIDVVDAAIGPKIAALHLPLVVVIPQLGPKSELGDLATTAGLRSFLEGALGRSIAAMGPIDVVAHSGGYQLAAAAATALPVRSIALLDALYGQIETFVAFAKRSASRRILSIFGPTTRTNSIAWIDRCKAAGVSTRLEAAPAAAVDVAKVRSAKAVALATSVFHPDVPAADAAAAIKAIGA